MNTIGEQGGCPAIIKKSGSGIEKVLFHGMQQGGRQGVLVIFVGLIVLKKGAFANVSVGRNQKGTKIAVA